MREAARMSIFCIVSPFILSKVSLFSRVNDCTWGQGLFFNHVATPLQEMQWLNVFLNLAHCP